MEIKLKYSHTGKSGRTFCFHATGNNIQANILDIIDTVQITAFYGDTLHKVLERNVPTMAQARKVLQDLDESFDMPKDARHLMAYNPNIV